MSGRRPDPVRDPNSFQVLTLCSHLSLNLNEMADVTEVSGEVRGPLVSRPEVDEELTPEDLGRNS